MEFCMKIDYKHSYKLYVKYYFLKKYIKAVLLIVHLISSIIYEFCLGLLVLFNGNIPASLPKECKR
jgi:hypothetical protein